MVMNTFLFGLVFSIMCSVWGVYAAKDLVFNSIRMTRGECYALNKTFSEFETCGIAGSRNEEVLSLKWKFYQLPIDEIVLKMKLFNMNGGSPVLEVEIDLCKFLGKRRNKFTLHLFRIISPYTNFNHSCPFNHDFVVTNCPTIVKSFPYPFKGNYVMRYQVAVAGVEQALMKLYFNVF